MNFYWLKISCNFESLSVVFFANIFMLNTNYIILIRNFDYLFRMEDQFLLVETFLPFESLSVNFFANFFILNTNYIKITKHSDFLFRMEDQFLLVENFLHLRKLISSFFCKYFHVKYKLYHNNQKLWLFV